MYRVVFESEGTVRRGLSISAQFESLGDAGLFELSVRVECEREVASSCDRFDCFFEDIAGLSDVK